jgi:hypothetical protein
MLQIAWVFFEISRINQKIALEAVSFFKAKPHVIDNCKTLKAVACKIFYVLHTTLQLKY